MMFARRGSDTVYESSGFFGFSIRIEPRRKKWVILKYYKVVHVTLKTEVSLKLRLPKTKCIFIMPKVVLRNLLYR
jgi:hypothetical protein